jgi:hypothetical protein
VARCIVLLLVGAGLAACGGGDSLELTAAPHDFAADGMTVVSLSAKVKFRGDPIADGKRVIFSSTAALLFSTREEVVAGKGVAELSVSTRGGVAVAYLLAPMEGGSLRVDASYTTVNKDVLHGFVAREPKPPLIAFDPTKPVAFTCTKRKAQDFSRGDYVENVGAFVPGRPEVRIPCTVALTDVRGTEFPYAPVRFFAEAGGFDDGLDKSGGRVITYVVPSIVAGGPRDVEPMQAELDAGVVNGSANPRDGLVTLLAVVRGQEWFDDANGNGVYDPGENFVDEGEPFLDVDDDGEFTSGVDVACCDSNNNGRVDGPNGKWDSDVWIGRLTHVLWSGPPSKEPERSAIVPLHADIDPGSSSGTLQLSLVDHNFNPIAAGDAGDAVTFTLSPSSMTQMEATGFSSSTVVLQNTSGILMKADFVFGRGQQVFTGLARDYHQFFWQWPFSIADKRSPTGSAVCAAATWELTAQIRYAPVAGVSTKTVDSVGASGELRAKPAPCP